MSLFFAFVLVNIVPGLGVYLLLHPLPHKKGELLAYSLVYSVIFTPIFLYLIRLIGLGNAAGTAAVLLTPIAAAFLIKLCPCKPVSLPQAAQEQPVQKQPALEQPVQKLPAQEQPGWILWCYTILFSTALLIVNLALIDGSVLHNGIFDSPKHYGTLISVGKSQDLVIDNAFATGFRMYYYFFFYYKAGALMLLSGMANTYQITFLVMMIESLVIVYTLIFLLATAGAKANKHFVWTCLILFVYLFDGGLDCVFIYVNQLFGYSDIDGWTRVMYPYLPVTVHPNFLVEIMWRPQHSAALVPFLVVVRHLAALGSESGEQRCKFQGLKTTILLSACLVSLIGYSALMALPGLAAVSAIVFYLVIKYWGSRGQLYNKLLFLPLGLILSCPLMLSCLHNGQSVLFLRPRDSWPKMMAIAPWTTLLNIPGEYGAMALLFLIAVIPGWRKSSQTQGQFLSLLVVITCAVGLMVLMPGDVGMAISTMLYTGITLFVVTSNWERFKGKAVLAVLVSLILVPGLITNYLAVKRQDFALQKPPTEWAALLEAAEYVRENSVSTDSAVFLEQEELNRFVPQLMHLATYSPVPDGVPYFTMQDQKTNDGVMRSLAAAAVNTRPAIYGSLGIDFGLCKAGGNADRSIRERGRQPSYQNREWVVYRLPPAATK